MSESKPAPPKPAGPGPKPSGPSHPKPTGPPHGNLRALNSMTKYPSIPTYHQLDPRNGSLLDNKITFDGQVIGTEKIDGTNARIILLPHGNYLLGSREELLYAKGDLIGNPALGIVENLKPIADHLIGDLYGPMVRVLYLELFGGKIGGEAKQYSTRGTVGWRLFDAVDIHDYDDKLSWDPARISAWRESRRQDFADEDELQATARSAHLALTPRLFTIEGPALPAGIEETYAFLGQHLPNSQVVLDDSGKGAGEGIVLRTRDRSLIAKARFQDYRRTLQRRTLQLQRRRGGAS